jgi:multiple sugar transport system substrate-binding protein/raffinose/stachyose/melibiose transport system substrate-binding protein
MIKKLLRLLILSSILVLALGVTQAQEDEGSDAGPFTYSSYLSDPEPRRVDEMIVEMWNERNPDAQVEHSIVGHEDFKQAIRAFLTATPSPDVLTWFAGNRARFFIDRDLVADFGDAWGEEGFGDAFSPGFQRLATEYGREGTYFLPGNYYWWAVYYRPSLFEEAGIEQPPETWDELLATCDALNEIGVTPFTIGTRFQWPAAAWFDYLNMRENGPQFHLDLMNLQESYTDERVLAVFDRWQELFDHNCFIENPAAYSWQEAVQFMDSGEAAMYLMGDFIRDEARANFPDLLEDLDYFQFPVINPDVEIGEDAPTDGWFLAANAENPEAAKDFLQFLGSQEIQQLYLDELGRLPTRTDVDLSNVDPLTERGIELVQSADVVTQFYDRDTTPEMASAGMDAMMEFWDNPDDIEAILEELDEDRIRIAEEQAEDES